MSILKEFKIPAASQVEIGNALLSAVTGEDFIHYDDAQISDLLHGKKNVGVPVVNAVKHCNNDVYIQRFEKSVLSQIDTNELSSVVTAMRNAIVGDEHIRPNTVVDTIGGATKFEISRSSSFFAPCFLAGIFRYVLLNVENKGTQEDAKAVDATYVDKARNESDGIVLVKSLTEISTEPITLWEDGPNSISIVAGDIFNYGIFASFSDRALLTIPVDTSFSTMLASGIEGGDPFLVSPKTLHGKFLQRENRKGTTSDELNQRIEKELCLAEHFRDSAGHFPIGSIAVLDDKNVSYCLIAIAEHDAYGNTQSTELDIRTAINNLVLLYDRRGLGYPLLIPLVGTGRSRSGLNPQKSFELLVNCLMENKLHIQGNVLIIVLPETFRKLNIESVVKYLGLQN